MLGLNNRVKELIIPASVSTSGTTATIDTVGGDYLAIYVAANTASTTMTALKLSEGDTTSSYTDIVAFTGGTATSTSVGFVIPSADTTNGVRVAFFVNLAPRKRYLQLTVTPGVAQVTHAWAEFIAEDDRRTTDAGLGYSEIVYG